MPVLAMIIKQLCPPAPLHYCVFATFAVSCGPPDPPARFTPPFPDIAGLLASGKKFELNSLHLISLFGS